MTLKKHIFFVGLLLLLPFMSGCLGITIRDNPYGNVSSNVLTGRIYKHVRIPFTSPSAPGLSMRDFPLPYPSDNFLQADAFSFGGPYTTDLHKTPVTDNRGSGTIFHIEEPFTGFNLYIEFNSNAIGDIAKKHGLTKVYFADIEIFEVLGGIWKHHRLHIYGE